MQGTVPIVMCDSEDGCDEWFIDNWEMGVSNWQVFVPEGWRYDPYDSRKPHLCPDHAKEQA